MAMHFKRAFWLELLIHVLFWLGLYVLIIGNDPSNVMIEQMGKETEVFDEGKLILWAYGLSALLFYLHILWLSNYYFKKQFLLYAAGIAFMLVGLVGAEYYWLSDRYGDFYRNHKWSTIALNHLVFVLFGLIYVLVKGQVRMAFEIREQKQDQLSQELTFLKSQVNPHFLFNTINNIFSIAQKNEDEEVAQYLADLSKIMRYSLYESNESRVSLKKEVNFLKSFIDMSRLKFQEGHVQVGFKVEGSLENQKIGPLLLIPLVENAFKHGVRPKGTNALKMHLKVEGDELEFTTENALLSYDQQLNSNYSGIGLSNLRRRLELMYPGKHQLDIFREKEQFRVVLNIKLNG